MAQKSPDGSVLLVIDMQHDFVDNPTSPVLVPGASNIILAVAHVVELARLAKVPVIWIVREHDSSGKLDQITNQYIFIFFSKISAKPLCRNRCRTLSKAHVW